MQVCINFSTSNWKSIQQTVNLHIYIKSLRTVDINVLKLTDNRLHTNWCNLTPDEKYLTTSFAKFIRIKYWTSQIHNIITCRTLETRLKTLKRYKNIIQLHLFIYNIQYSIYVVTEYLLKQNFIKTISACYLMLKYSSTE
jgi:hypothetical protein